MLRSGLLGGGAVSRAARRGGRCLVGGLSLRWLLGDGRAMVLEGRAIEDGQFVLQRRDREL